MSEHAIDIEGVVEWRWVDDKGRGMTSWRSGPPPPVLDLSDAKGQMHVEVRIGHLPEDEAKGAEG